MTTKLEEVYGVSSAPVLSYVDRLSVDDRFVEALKSDKQVVVYGSSKQGKTSLVSKYLPYEKHIVVRLTPKTEISDVYSSILRQLGITIQTAASESSGRESKLTVGAKFKALIPLFGSGEASTEGEVGTSATKDKNFQEIPFNLELPQDISELFRKSGSRKSVILENFHYLDDNRQKQLAFDLRTFQELGIRFVILGVWREKNRLAQFNGDLLDRVTEIPVEPWELADFVRVAEKGEPELNIKFSDSIIEQSCNASFSSIGVFQELLKEMCLTAGIRERQANLVKIDSLNYFQTAVKRKAEEYAARHQRALESIAAGNFSSSIKDGVVPLFLPFYLVKVILAEGYEGLANGMRRNVIQERIQQLHHRPNDVRASDMSNLLYNLAALQNNKSISPPIVDYDQNTKMLQVVDSTFYFFLKNANLAEIADEIPNPLESVNTGASGLQAT